MRNDTTATVQLGNWYAVAAVAAASFGLAGGAHEADAAQIVVIPVGGPVTAPIGPGGSSSSQGAVYFNLLDTTGTQVGTVVPPSSPPHTADFALTWGRSFFGTGASAVGNAGLILTTPSHSSYAAKLGNHAPVGVLAGFFSSSVLLGSKSRSSISGPYGKWKPGDTGYIGLAAVNGSSALVFGWAEIHLGSGSNAYDPTLIEWGFNDQPLGTAFTGGTAPAPEPSSLLLLATGAAGLAAYRRRNARRRAAAE